MGSDPRKKWKKEGRSEEQSSFQAAGAAFLQPLLPSLPSCFNGRAPDESALPDNKTAGRAAALSKVFHLRETVCCRGSHRTGTVSTAAALPAGGWPRLLEHQRRQSVNSKAPAASACVSGDDILRVSDGHESRVAPRDKKRGYCHRARGGQQQHSTHTHGEEARRASSTVLGSNDAQSRCLHHSIVVQRRLPLRLDTTRHKPTKRLRRAF